MTRRAALRTLGISTLGAACPASVPSFTLARVQGARITTQALGVQRNGESSPVSADTVYAAASLTKAVFAYTFLSFVQDGLVSLDRPVRDYLETVVASQCAWQWGDNPGCKSCFWADPLREQAMVVFTNGDRGARCTSA